MDAQDDFCFVIHSFHSGRALVAQDQSFHFGFARVRGNHQSPLIDVLMKMLYAIRIKIGEIPDIPHPQ
jgi:hypothetical protein